MSITGRGIWTPDDGDNFDFTVDLGAMAESIDLALGDVEDSALEEAQEGVPRRFNTLSALQAWTPADGAIAFVVADSRHYVRLDSEWRGVAEHDYSTTEVDTGRRWIDGKIIYSRVFTGTISQSGTDRVFVTLLSGVDKLIHSGGWWEASDGARKGPNHMYVGSSMQILHVAALQVNSNNNLQLMTRSDNPRSNLPYEIYVEYTKL